MSSNLVKCKRCGRALRSPESIKRGYGPKCFRMIQFEENNNGKEVQNEIDFLKCEINMVKRLLKQISSKPVYQPMESIQRIKRDEYRLERDENKKNMCVVINELKTIFKSGNPRAMLVSAPPKSEISLEC